MGCIWRDDDGDWHRSLLHMWHRRTYRKVCVRCGKSRALVF